VRRAKTVAGRVFRQYRFPAMSEPLRLTIDYKTGDDGWIIASVPEVPGAHSQGRTRKEARANVIDALRGVLELRLGEHAIREPGGDRERLELTIA
jgi:predicted RNase H-like HicB family nuclease